MILIEIDTWQLDSLGRIIPIKMYVCLVQITLVTYSKVFYRTFALQWNKGNSPDKVDNFYNLETQKF